MTHQQIWPSSYDKTLTSTTTTTILRPLYRTTYISRHPQLRTGGFCWSKVLLPTCPCWRQLRIQIREKTREFSWTLLPAPSPWHHVKKISSHNCNFTLWYHLHTGYRQSWYKHSNISSLNSPSVDDMRINDSAGWCLEWYPATSDILLQRKLTFYLSFSSEQTNFNFISFSVHNYIRVILLEF